MGPLGSLFLSCGNASSCWSQLWGPSALRTSYQLVSEPIGSRFPEEVAARQMVEVYVHSRGLRTLQDDEQTNSDDDQTSDKIVVKASA